MLSETAHRPWPLPKRPWVMAMEWYDLLFMHWPISPSLLAGLLPPGLTLDTFDGAAWLSIVPFRMAGVTPRFVPPLPWISAFPELNVRTYVTAEGKPGVWFFSLDAANPLAVEAARDVFHLRYYNAAMSCTPQGDGIAYASRRTHRHASPAEFRARYRPTGPERESSPGSLEHWLTERYCLYAANRHGTVWRGEIHHPAWRWQPAEAEVEVNTMTEQIGLRLPETPPLLQFDRAIRVAAWWPERLSLR